MVFSVTEFLETPTVEEFGLNNIYSNIKHQYSYYNVINSGFSNKIKSYLKLSP